MLRCLRSAVLSAPSMPQLMGLCIGVALSLVLAPPFMKQCPSSESDSSVKRKPDHVDYVVRHIDGADSSAAASLEGKGPPQRLKRPRFLSTELEIREKLFIGILTGQQTADTRCVAVNRTVSHLVEKLMMFMSVRPNESPALPVGMPLLVFKDVKTYTTPQQMWRYVTQNFVQSYDWFFFAPDSTYINADRLTRFVDHLGVTDKLIIGRPVDTDDSQPSSCDFHAGVLLTRGVLSYLAENLDWCLRNAMPDGGDADNVRTCLAYIADRLNISCTDRLNEVTYTSYIDPVLDASTDVALRDIADPGFSTALTVGHLQDDTQMYRLHRFISEQSMADVHLQLSRTMEGIVKIAPLTPEGNASLVWPLGTSRTVHPKTRFDVNRWQYFTEKHIYLDTEFSNIKELIGVDKKDVSDIISVAVERLNQNYPLPFSGPLATYNRFLYRRLLNGYRRYDATRGMEYTLDLMLLDQVSRTEVPRRVHLLRPLGRLEIIPMPYVTENTRVSLLLPVTASEKDNVLSFLDAYAHTCLESGDNAYLLVVFIYMSPEQESTDIYAVIKSTISFYENRYLNGARVTWTSVHSPNWSDRNTPFLILDSVSRRLTPESLVLFCTVGMDLSIELLNRVRMNTIAGWQVFFPIGYWLYRPNLVYDQKPYPTLKEINQKSGRYDDQQFVHSSFYMADYRHARKQMVAATTTKSELDLYDMFIKYHNVHILRAVEPALRLQFREFSCDSEDMTYTHRAECLSTRAHSLATRAQLAMLVFEYQQKLDQMQLKVMQQQHNENVGQMRPEMLRK